MELPIVRLPWRSSASEMFVNLNIRSFDRMLRIFTLDLCQELLFLIMCLYLISTTHPVVCIQIFGLGGMAHYT